MKNLTLERATIKDVDTFLELERSIGNVSTYSAMTNREEALEEMKTNVVYFIRVGDRIIGDVMYEMKSPGHAYISGLVVRPDFQGRGFGTAAMVKVLEELRDVSTIDLVTHPDNVRSIKLYESLGFIIGKRIENYFGDGEPRIVMTFKR